MSRSLPIVLLLAAGCSMTERGSPGPAPSSTATVRSSPATSALQGAVSIALPTGFPVLPGADAVPLPKDDPGLIGLWETDQVGSAAYDFYLAALPDAGYPLVGLYPGGDVALVRFAAPGGVVWQLVVHGDGRGGTAIEVRLDRP